MEWTNDDPRGRLDIPKDLLASQRFRWSATLSPQGMPLIGTCADFEVMLNGVRLAQCLTDTSERVHGTTLRRRVTFRAELFVIGTPVLIFPFNSEEMAGDPPECITPGSTR